MFVIDATTLPIILLVLTTVFSSIGFLFKWRVGLIKPLEEKEEIQEEEKHERRKMPKLIYHPVFNELDELESYFATRYRHPDLGRQIIASEMMVHKIRIWRPLLMEFAVNIDNCCETCDLARPECNKVLNLAVDVLIRGMEQYVQWHLRDTVLSIDESKVYTKADKETMRVYIEKFRDWHSSREELVRLMTHEVGSSPLYDSCHQKAYLILQGYHLAFSLCRVDSDKTLKSLNGSLTGRSILGVKIGDAE